MGALCSRVQRKPFARLRKFFQDRRERLREKKRQKELAKMGVNAADVAPQSNSPILGGVASDHSSLDSTSLNVTTERSDPSVHSVNSHTSGSSTSGSHTSGSSSGSTPTHWNMLTRTAKNVNDDDDDDDSDDSGDSDEGIPLGASRPSGNWLGPSGSDHHADDDVEEEDTCTGNLRLRKYVSEQSDVHRRLIEADDARRAVHRQAHSLTSTVARLPSIPENDILANVANSAQPLPILPPRQPQRQGDVFPDDFHLPGFIP